MRKQLSNSNMFKSKILLLVFGGILFIGFSFFDRIFESPNKTNEALFVLIPFIIIYYFFIGRYYTVHLDSRNLYFTGAFKKGIIPHDKLISVNSEFFSVNWVFSKSFPITVRYKNQNGKVRKITFLSTEVGRFDGPEKIYALKLLREIIELNQLQ